MQESVTATEANRNFAALLRHVKEGKTYLITSHGRTIARIEPADDADAQRAEAHRALIERLRTQPGAQFVPWTRDELYDDEPNE
ncbi:MAG: type II toxin-antitoxin system prevent-host-death family antitoxin [Thermomicrobiales bacterium]|nr:type II toxin-antitoxin system prevent-host-death family antitoxin [Thermomicrobiales bacterium]MCO5222690.1 type II toxin-antitoxin system prevent-host-death family antitoxin [Thermomicrobiales bacterium]